MTHYSRYSEDQIQPVFKLMVDYLRRPVTHEAFFKKYASKKFLKGLLNQSYTFLTLTDDVTSIHPDASVGQEVSSHVSR